MLCMSTNEESYLAAYSNGRKFLYNSKGLDVSSLLVKYYVPLAHINKVIKLLKLKSAIICSVSNGRRNRESATECDCESRSRHRKQKHRIKNKIKLFLKYYLVKIINFYIN